MESQMTREELETVIQHLEKELEINRSERKEVAEIYEKQKQIEFHFISIAGITIVLHITLVQWLMQQDSLSLKAVGSYIQPINFIVFMAAAIYAIVRGYDLFMNSNYVLARKLNEKLKKRSITNELQMMLENTRFLQREIDRLNGELRALDKKEDTEQLNEDIDVEESEENSSDMWEKDVLKKDS